MVQAHDAARWTCVLQVIGFLVLVAGSSLYNELIRSCLPAVYPAAPDAELEARCHAHQNPLPDLPHNQPSCTKPF
jgi:hypothetical protein